MSELVPRLRFKGFNESLIKHKVREFCSVKSGSTPLRSINAYFKMGHIPWVKTTDLNNSLITSTEEQVTELAMQETSLRLNPKGSVLVAMYGGFNQIGRTGLLTKPSTTNQALSVLNPERSQVLPIYLQHYLNANIFRWRRFAASSRKDPNITSSDVGSFLVSYCSPKEQQKIADFLTSVDSKISQLTEKHRLLTQYKKGVMQQILSQQLRFKDDDGSEFGEWVEEKIGKYLEQYKELVPADTNIPILTSSRTGLYIQERSVINEGNYGVVPYGYFTYRHMSDDLIFKFNINTFCEKGAVSKEYPVFKTINMDSYFLQLQLNEGDAFKRFAVQQKLGGTRTRLYFKNLKELTLKLPCLKEQQKIAQFLQAIDARIDATSQQLEQAKLFKKGLLQQMFV